MPEKIYCPVKDRQDFQIPDRVHQTGWVGSRLAANARNRLAKIDLSRLLEGYRKRQFNAQLLRLTGEARFADYREGGAEPIARAQRPDCAAWCYYVQMEGKKRYSDSLDGHCCLSSGPRGVACFCNMRFAVPLTGCVKFAPFLIPSPQFALQKNHT